VTKLAKGLANLGRLARHSTVAANHGHPCFLLLIHQGPILWWVFLINTLQYFLLKILQATYQKLKSQLFLVGFLSLIKILFKK